jgi:hypothetical protein
MDKCKEITFCAKELLRTHRIQVSEANKKEVITLLSDYIDLLIFNIVAVVSIICANIGVKKVILQHIQFLSKYIDKRCCNKKAAKAAKAAKPSARMSGGAFNTAAFYGVSEPRYSVENVGRDLLTIDFTSGTARNAIPMMGGGSGGSGRPHLKTPSCIKLDKIVARKIKNVFKFFGLAVNKEAVAHLKAKYDTIVDELFESMKKAKGIMTPAKVSQFINKSKIMKKK